MSTWFRSVAACAGLALLAGCSGVEDRSAGPAEPATPIPPRWEIVYSSPSATSSFGAIALAKDEVWALGDDTRPGSKATYEVLLRLRDGKWDRPALPPEYLGAGQITNLQFVAAPGSPDVWLFARIDEKPKAWHWDGRRWVGMPGAPSTLKVQALAPDDIWALDWTGGFLHHWDGMRWTAQKISISASSFSAASSDDIWAAGYAVGAEGVMQPAVLHFDGRSWHRTPTPEYRFGKKPVDTESATLQNIVAVAPNEAWAFGDHSSTATGAEAEKFVLRWNGSQWEKAAKSLHSEAPVPDGDGGLVVPDAGVQHTADGQDRPIDKLPLLPGLSGKVAAADRSQRLSVTDAGLASQTKTVWTVGFVGTAAYDGDSGPYFSRGVILRLNPGRR